MTGQRRLADLVRQHREREGLTQQQLAERSGISRNTIAAIELGRVRIPSPEIVRSLARPLRVTVREMLQAMGYPIEDDAAAAAVAEDRVLQEIADLLARFRRGGATGDAESGA
jgi:transcriptional regulator with XRE-family HTH domain